MENCFLLFIVANILVFVNSFPVDLKEVINNNKCNFPPVYLASDDRFVTQFQPCSRPEGVLADICANITLESSLCDIDAISRLPASNVTWELFKETERKEEHLTKICGYMTTFPWTAEECQRTCNESFFICDLYVAMDKVLRRFFEMEVKDYTCLHDFIHSGKLSFLFPYPPRGALDNFDLLQKCGTPTEDETVKQLCNVMTEVAVSFLKNRVSAKFHEDLTVRNVTSQWDPCRGMSAFNTFSASNNFRSLTENCGGLCANHTGICKSIYLGLEKYQQATAGRSSLTGSQQPAQQPSVAISGSGQPAQQPAGTLPESGQPAQQPAGTLPESGQPAQQPAGTLPESGQPAQQPAGTLPESGQPAQQPAGTLPESGQPAQQPAGTLPESGQPGQQPAGTLPESGQPAQQPAGTLPESGQPAQQPAGTMPESGQPAQQPAGTMPESGQPAQQPAGTLPESGQPAQQPAGTMPESGQPAQQPAGTLPESGQPAQQPAGTMPESGQPAQQPAGTMPESGQPAQQPAGTLPESGQPAQQPAGTLPESGQPAQQPAGTLPESGQPAQQPAGTLPESGQPAQQPAGTLPESGQPAQQPAGTLPESGQPAQQPAGTLPESGQPAQQPAGTLPESGQPAQQPAGTLPESGQPAQQPAGTMPESGQPAQQPAGTMPVSVQPAQEQTQDDRVTATASALSSTTEDYYYRYGADDDKPAESVDLNKKPEQTKLDKSVGYAADDEESSGGHFMAYFLVFIVLSIAGYIIFHNKQKIIALVIEGKTGKGGRRPNTKDYKQLKTEDVMPSLEKSAYSKDYVF
ncbi:SUMO-interacting motif-containing protein 1-like isoform X2 [Mercenaria mercenaria]|uniref:SUMO-interacting motif-containing protein 1-like isoform X2 n=1 Tax=Mercenaria mercenaria TaxID=6596 RepID=UPI00234F894E|nr:SUMO-interacting motif-containing protein 1-like isoform X2 [Mercenaria mercenaria]